MSPGGEAPVLRACDLTVEFALRRGVLRREVGRLAAVRSVSLSIERGETLGLVGASGSGKSTLGRALVRLVEPTAGRVELVPEPGAAPLELTALGGARLRRARRHLGIVFQDPFASLNPRFSVAELVGEPLALHLGLDRAARRARAAELLERVGLCAADLERAPHELSGGERQRVAIARALAAEPELVVLDEVTSALDAPIQAQILDLLLELARDRRRSFLLISHDLTVVRHLADRIGVLHQGELVELGPAGEVLERPAHAATRALLAAAPSVV